MFEKEAGLIDSLNNDDELFEMEVLKLKDMYDIPDFDSIHDFLSKNRGVIVILNEVKPLLSQHVPYAFLTMRLDDDPLFVPQLQLMVKAPEINFSNGFQEDIDVVKYQIRPLVLHFNLHKEFFIWDECL